jgi:hypothetical protein
MEGREDGLPAAPITSHFDQSESVTVETARPKRQPPYPFLCTQLYYILEVERGRVWALRVNIYPKQFRIRKNTTTNSWVLLFLN